VDGTVIKGLLVIMAAGAALWGLWKYGRSSSSSALKRGTETVDSVLHKVQPAALSRLKPHLAQAGFSALPSELVLVGLKEEQQLEVYARRNGEFVWLKSYPFTAFSGRLGPKLQEGDRQIPEGIYNIEYLNPNSAYYLSMKISYPNAFDLQKTRFSDLKELGGDIFIHGKAVTIGCIPVGDPAIEELFLLVGNALERGVKVIISPRDFRVNPEFPKIEGIDWEEELYENVRRELERLNRAGGYHSKKTPIHEKFAVINLLSLVGCRLRPGCYVQSCPNR